MADFLLLRWGETPYTEALSRQQQLVAQVLAGQLHGALVLTEHPHVYTVGRATPPREVLQQEIHGQSVPVVATDRGGRATYHGPGQTIAYVVRDMRPTPHAVRAHVTLLEELVLSTLAALGLTGQRDPHAPGVWVAGAKVAALGVRISRGVAYHGVAINRQPELDYFQGIIPCGLANRPVTSLAQLGLTVSRQTLENLLIRSFVQLFGALPVEPPPGRFYSP